MKYLFRKHLLTLLWILVPSSGFAEDLIDIYRQALENDPVFKQAYSTYFSSREALPQAKAALKPNLYVTGYVSRTSNNGDSQVGVAGDQSYNSASYTLAASQPVFNYQSWMGVQKAKESVKQAEAAFNASAQDLIIRVAQAYLDVLQAKDKLRFTQAEKRANLRQLEQAQQRYKVGLDTITSVYEAQAAYDSAVAQEISDKNNLINQFENLRTLTNRTHDLLAPLKESKLPLVKPNPANVDEWVKKALEQNYSLISSKYSMEAARKNIKQTQAGHYPTVDLQGSYTDLENDASISTVEPTGNNSVVSLNLTFPVYQGGLVVSQTRQAQYDFQTAAGSYQSVYLNTLVNTRKAYNTIIDGISKIKADKRAVVSSQNSLDSTEAQFQVGTRTMVDVLDAQQQLYQSQTQQAADQYGYIKAILQLKLSAGTLSVMDLQEINSWLNKDPKAAVRDPL